MSEVANTPAPAPTAAKGIDPKSLDAILNTGLVVGGTIARQRQQSGRAAARQARIAACGRKPLIGKKKKAAYNKCVADAQAGANIPNTPLTPPDFRSGGGGEEGGDNKTLMYVGIGLGVVVLGVVGYILYKKFGK